MNISFDLPVQILANKISTSKTNSIFYHGKRIASALIAREKGIPYRYYLTTAGAYDFERKAHIGTTRYRSEDSGFKTDHLDDVIIKKISDEGLIHNWGWFCIERWVKDDQKGTLGECYSTYDEAMEAFLKLVPEDIEKGLAESITVPEIELLPVGPPPTEMNCIICGTRIELASGIHNPGIPLSGGAGYGSDHDGDEVEAIICDDCITKAYKENRLRWVRNCMIPEMKSPFDEGEQA